MLKYNELTHGLASFWIKYTMWNMYHDSGLRLSILYQV